MKTHSWMGKEYTTGLTREQKESMLVEDGVGILLLDKYFEARDWLVNRRESIAELKDWFLTAPRTERTKNAMLIILPNIETEYEKAKVECRKWLNKYQRRLSTLYPQQEDSTRGKLDIDKAKETPMEEAFDFEGLHDVSCSRAKAKCPFHDERTASFVIYKDDNHGHCFGCSWHGDVIDLIQQTNSLSFREAVKQLI